MSQKHIDELSGVETTGHEWDGIQELNNPMPRWWIWTFYVTILWAIGYAIAYPAIPMITSATNGYLGYSTRAELQQDLNLAKSSQTEFHDLIAAKTVEEIDADPALRKFAIAGGASAFKVNCAPCHGSGASGGPGFPNLNDDDWLWGGDLNAIQATISHGIRFDGDTDSHSSEMPPFAGVLEPIQMKQVAAFVWGLTNTPSDVGLAAAGKQVFFDNCAPCHGEDAKGKVEMGAPDLADAIWLKSRGEDAILRQVASPKHGVMPAWAARLGDTTVNELTIFVHALGGGT
ncbi:MULTISPECIES: cytochrome-c oxidase, cbb3-type subunit III [Rhizobium]|jgi:cytochrome c oxidase cbb3-type subunit 3|uniref:Cbb3-type cytochrome c oxidase subunit FixP n=11 Tax=Rhizobium TaxID=379 RepID=FIXP_RHIEC|nr:MULTISPECIES: cytochrome-c oxidase, cbb3-type subunit III [Rhizobium]Q8KLH5.1 RecName: Full=Cbb3-type cytochrome c oxidase subunit FixP; Short=Cbb3-Cox subunit FixP; AltName: Full=C-type cytochrome FixP; Short=Cyt c(FixP); AltName: Full=Cytochrome c oxidase subunit III [Rhizobium etli CFN 42]ACE94032.1 cytochrome c oxidase protein, FixP chain (cbb3-type subunit III) [Rhizobium etli CIAT 652]EGE58663.1 cytochrome C oxidase, fixP chain (cbb3-type subunit III) protein [Rhizobium etli CNPAF512]A